MSEPLSTTESTPSSTGRASRGRFAKSNPGGPGNPTVDAPSPNGDFGAADVAAGKKPPSSNGKIQRPPPLAGFDWLDELRRAFGSHSPP